MPDVETATSDYDRERLRERLAKLASGVAIIRVGGATETDATVVGGGHRSATCATTLAGSGRVHFSGALYGPFLASAYKAMNAFAFASLSETHGIHELQRPAPTSASASASFGAPWSSRSATSRFNAGVDGSIVVGKLVDQQDIDYGFDAQSLQYADLVDAGIVDPTKVVRLALQDAASIAGLLITTEVMVAGRPEDETPSAFQ
jgi:chaperonin GroEL